MQKYLRGRTLVAVLLAIGGAALAGVFALRALGDDEASCENVANRPVTQLPVTEERFDTAYQGIAETRELTQEARSAPPEERQRLLDEAFTTFYAQAHDLTHDFDFELCEEDRALAEDTRETVVELETALGNQNNPQEILDRLDDVESLLREAEPKVV